MVAAVERFEFDCWCLTLTIGFFVIEVTVDWCKVDGGLDEIGVLCDFETDGCFCFCEEIGADVVAIAFRVAFVIDVV